MKTQLLRKLWAELVEGLAAAKRHYSLNDKYAVQIEVGPVGFDGERLSANLTIHERLPAEPEDNVPEEWDCIDMDSLPAWLLARVAEYKVLVERFNANELDEFPESTMPNFLAAQEGRQRARRHRRFARH
jgi:hypothetical protein